MKTRRFAFLFTVFAAFVFGCNAGKPSFDKPPVKKVPLVYSSGYNIGFLGLQRLHSFDTKKYKNVVKALLRDCGITRKQFHKPTIVTNKELELVHSKEYFELLKDNTIVGEIAELKPYGVNILSYIPNFLNCMIQRSLLNPMRLATGGTLLAAELALENEKAAVNIGGGYHHAKKESGSGFCFFGDIQFAVEKLWQKNPNLKVMIVDLDAHQGNGHEDYFKGDKRISIFDVYSYDVYSHNYPDDKEAKQYITYDYPVRVKIQDEEYLKIVDKLRGAVAESMPDLIIYNAGTDPFEEDELGRMCITKEGLIERDEKVFKFARENNVPVCMVTSGGYSKESAGIIADSLKNLMLKDYLDC